MPALLIGYAYAGKAGPSLEEQRAALLAAGLAPDKLYADDFTAARKPRLWLPEFVRSLPQVIPRCFPASMCWPPAGPRPCSGRSARPAWGCR